VAQSIPRLCAQVCLRKRACIGRGQAIGSGGYGQVTKDTAWTFVVVSRPDASILASDGGQRRRTGDLNLRDSLWPYSRVEGCADSNRGEMVIAGDRTGTYQDDQQV
jgi:hypothetical protein